MPGSEQKYEELFYNFETNQKQMATRYRFGSGDYPHFITYSVINWVDALSRTLYKDIIIDSLNFCISQKGMRLHAWVIMNNHVHLIASCSGPLKMEDIMRDHKKFTASEILRSIENNPQESRKDWMLWLFKSAGLSNPNNKHFQFWQQDNHPILLSNQEMAIQKLNYIHHNPVRAGIVFEPQHYVYSSAADYSSLQPGLLPLEFLI